MIEMASETSPEAGRPSGSPSRLEKLAAHYPVIIIGGGINGCGLFRDLNAQGVNCLLLDRQDFCSGASASPSRLIHGGIKYLETGEFRLVRQSARERNLLLQNAPHYVKPLETVLPVYSWWGGIIPSIRRFLGLKTKMNDRGAAITEVGLLLYDLFGRHFRTMPRHRMLLRKSALKAMPDLNRKIIAAGIYYEGRVTHSERLALELILDGSADNPGSLALNHAVPVGTADGGIEIRDALTGRTAVVKADIVINAGGAWIDAVNADLGIASRHMGGNKGSHIIVRNERLVDALDGRMIYFGSADGRVNLLYPFMGNVLVGSTDIPIEDPDDAVCSDEERTYLVSVTREVFPEIEIQPEEIVMTYCGVRPLPRSEGMDPGLVSRDHSIAEDTLPGTQIPVYSLIGGKWTTFRGFAEEAADLVLKRLGHARRKSTENLPIGGGTGFPADAAAMERVIDALASVGGRSRETTARSIERYGMRASDLMRTLEATRAMPLTSLPDFELAELHWICRNEMVEHLDDLLFRRTEVALSGRMSLEVIRETAGIAAGFLGWETDRQEREVADVIALCSKSNIALG